MKNIPFVIWMLGWPIMRNVGIYSRFLSKVPETEMTTGLAIMLIAWYMFVGILLYEGKGE